MANSKNLEIKGLSDAELIDELASMEREYQKFQFDHAIKGLENPLSLKEMRRDIARVKTEMRSRELANMSPEALAKRSKLRVRRRSE